MSGAFMSGFMGGSGGGNSLDMGSGVGDFTTDDDNQWGDWGGDMNIAPPPASGGLGIDLSNPGHVALVGAGLLILGAVLMRRAR